MIDQTPIVINAPLFQAIEALAREIIAVSNGHSSRAKVLSIANVLRAQALSEYGHDTPEVVALLSLLQRTDPKNADQDRPPPRMDPIKELELEKKLNVAQVSAAAAIAEIWLGWSRHLAVSGRSYDGDGSGKRKALGPVDTMSQRVWDNWNKRYRPWCNIAREKVIGGTNAADIVFKIVVEQRHLDILAHSMSLDEELLLKILRRELNRFNEITIGCSTPVADGNICG